jgi:hypothetical protein
MTRCAGTNTSDTSTSWLPVARSPTVSHVSMIRHCATGTKLITICGSSVGAAAVPPGTTTHESASQVQWWQLLTNGHRPLTRYPPSTSTAWPIGAITPLSTTSCPAPMSRAPAGCRNDWSMPAMPLFSAHQAADPSWRASSSTTATTVSGSASSPPSSRARQRRNIPASVSAPAAASGSRRSLSPASARRRRTSPIPAAAATSVLSVGADPSPVGLVLTARVEPVIRR